VAVDLLLEQVGFSTVVDLVVTDQEAAVVADLVDLVVEALAVVVPEEIGNLSKQIRFLYIN
jgi:hypothetical protein